MSIFCLIATHLSLTHLSVSHFLSSSHLCLPVSYVSFPSLSLSVCQPLSHLLGCQYFHPSRSLRGPHLCLPPLSAPPRRVSYLSACLTTYPFLPSVCQPFATHLPLSCLPPTSVYSLPLWRLPCLSATRLTQPPPVSVSRLRAGRSVRPCNMRLSCTSTPSWRAFR